MANMTKDRITSTGVTTEELRLAASSILQISHDYSDTSTRHIPSSKALSDATNQLLILINKFDPNNNVYKDSATISLNLMSNTLASVQSDPEKGYDILGFIRDLAGLRYTNLNNSPNYIRVLNKNISKEGKYIFVINISEITGTSILQIRNNEGYIFGRLETQGTHVVELECTSVTSDEFIIEAVEMSQGNTIKIESITFNYVTDRLYYYILHRIIKYITETGGLVDQEDLIEAINILETNLINVINDNVSIIEDDLAAHKAANNPHGITPAIIGAAITLHTHTPFSIGAADRDHTHTLASLGAAAIGHSHTPESLGAARAVHNHDERYLLKTDLITPKMIKPSIVVEAPLGKVPEYIDHTQVSLPTCSIQSMRLVHLAEGYYDYYSGYITSTKQNLESYPLYDAVRFNKFTRFAETSGEFIFTELRYHLHCKRNINSIVFRKDPTINAYPTEVSIYVDNGSLMVYSLSWINHEASIILPSGVVGNKLTIRINELNILDTWSIGFDVYFGDTDSQPLMVTKDIICTFEDANTVVMSPVTENNLPFTIDDIKDNHPYFIALQQGIAGLEVHIADIPPQYGVVDRGIAPFLNEYNDGPVNEFYGTISATDSIAEYPVEYIYGESTPSFRASTDTIITHNFNKSRHIFDCAILFDKNEIEYIPTHIVVKGLTEDSTIITIADIENYIPDINNGGSENITIEVPIDTTISQLIFEMSGSIDGEIRVKFIKIALSSEFYNINRFQWNDSAKRNYIGVVYKRNGYYETRPYPTGDSTCLPVNSLNICRPGTSYEIVNPFGSMNIGTDIICIKHANQLISPIAYITSITRDKLVIQTDTADIFAVSIFRNW